MKKINHNQQLIQAAENGDMEALRQALAQGGDALGEALVAAFKQKRVQTMLFLLDQGADLGACDRVLMNDENKAVIESLVKLGCDLRKYDSRLLMQAIANNDVEWVRRLLELKANCRSKPKDLLLAAVKTKTTEILAMLIARGIKPEIHGGNALIEAIEANKIEAVRLLLVTPWKKPGMLMWIGIGLDFAYSEEKFNILYILIKNFDFDEYDKHVFRFAVGAGFRDIAQELLDNGADPNAFGGGILFDAAARDLTRRRFLLEAANNQELSNLEKSEIELEILQEHEAILRLLLDKGGNVFSFDDLTLEQLPERNAKIVAQLLEEYADPEKVAAVGGSWWKRWLPRKRRGAKKPQ